MKFRKYNPQKDKKATYRLWHEAGWVGELHPQWQRKYELPAPMMLVELDAEALETVPLPRAEVPSRFPAVVRDISMLFDSRTPAQALLDAIYAERPGIVRQVGIFDLYQGKGLPDGKKSLALRVVMQDTERTLTDAEADEARDAIVALLSRKFSATLRS